MIFGSAAQSSSCFEPDKFEIFGDGKTLVLKTIGQSSKLLYVLKNVVPFVMQVDRRYRSPEPFNQGLPMNRGASPCIDVRLDLKAEDMDMITGQEVTKTEIQVFKVFAESYYESKMKDKKLLEKK